MQTNRSHGHRDTPLELWMPPIQAIVHAYALDERTVAHWRDRAGEHCHHVHEYLIEQGKQDGA